MLAAVRDLLRSAGDGRRGRARQAAQAAVAARVGKPPAGAARAATRPAAPAGPPPPWFPARIDFAESLWGEGFVDPGGAEEALRLAKPLGLTAAASVLLLGARAGGGACAIAGQLGAWVNAVEADPDLLTAARRTVARANMTKRVELASWSPDRPEFRARAAHHAVALEPLRGSLPEPVLAAIARALKPSGQLVLVELVAETPLDADEPAIRDWCALETRGAGLPSAETLTRMLGRLAFDVRVVEDVSERHLRMALLGFRQKLRAVAAAPPQAAEAALLVREAELWLRRQRLMREGRVRLLRWHAIATRPAG